MYECNCYSYWYSQYTWYLDLEVIQTLSIEEAFTQWIPNKLTFIGKISRQVTFSVTVRTDRLHLLTCIVQCPSRLRATQCFEMCWTYLFARHKSISSKDQQNLTTFQKLWWLTFSVTVRTDRLHLLYHTRSQLSKSDFHTTPIAYFTLVYSAWFTSRSASVINVSYYTMK